MIAEAVRRSPLADYADRFAALSKATDGALSIRELPFVSQVNLRADPKDADLMRRLATAIGFALPIVPNTVTSQEGRRALWLAPDEWLVVGPDGQQGAIERELRTLSPIRPRLAVSALGEDAVLQGAVATALAVAQSRLFDPATMLDRKELVV